MLKKIAIGLVVFLSMSCAYAGSVHTWHTISATSSSWTGKLQMLFQGGSFVTRDGKSLTDFEISPTQAIDYGFMFNKGADFDIAYTLTLVEKPNLPAFESKACVFVITASAPAVPDVRISGFNGAVCNFKPVRGRGGDFIVS